MSWRRATLIVAGFAGIFLLLSGCASVKSTAIYYRSIKDYPAKPLDAAIPILTRPPVRPYKVIGRMAFESDRGWNFIRKSMIYNAQIHGADAVLLRTAKTRREVSLQYSASATGLVSGLPARHARQGRNSLGALLETRTSAEMGRRNYGN
jgi:hypothetical protein